MSTATASARPSHEAFERTTSLWGTITLGMGLIIATSMPFLLWFTSGVEITWVQIGAAFLAVFAVYGAFYVIEPLTYFPILGPAGMYQAFMIGNVANKLLPAAIVAQSTIGVKPGTRKSEYVATAAICGAAVIHVVSMLLFVGLLGTWLVSITPEPITEVARIYILPAILGGVTVQLIATIKQIKGTIIALGVSALIILVVVPLFPVLSPGGTAMSVLLTIILTWFLRDRNTTSAAPQDMTSIN
ncbi:hypothetical protein [Brevibacterium luteolum]|uniref:hypothetical protein n=1 Tax=Brevibacterium luteolum TaxID=199591 RepID=UPI001C211169|nr:hypothetical protein [Brevibacterium luteolum]MBU8579026.1 hypothetical protein [Brevibacterium luteolum]MCT1874371.1 hypothetical protein [Brevibacterium luteolum]MCT1889628.1 hypothetical protein [Brevibacterium luteolum]MCT1893259.1 hypothetical protein [Brevibacterium luteolum]MCT1922951.1 hypothetical protein [Brevibacterium luteolum]